MKIDQKWRFHADTKLNDSAHFCSEHRSQLLIREPASELPPDGRGWRIGLLRQLSIVTPAMKLSQHRLDLPLFARLAGEIGLPGGGQRSYRLATLPWFRSFFTRRVKNDRND